MSIRILVGKSIISIFSVYAPQTCLSVIEKDSFYSALLTNISTVSHDEYLLVCGDFNGHVGKAPEGFSGVHMAGLKEIVNEREKRGGIVKETVESLVKQKRKLWKEWQKGGSKEKYLEAKCKEKSGVYVLKEKFIQLESSDGKNFIFKLAKRM